MEKMNGTMWTIIVFYLLQAVRSQENTDNKCSVEFDGECVRRVSCNVEENAIIGKSELFVSYKNQEQGEEGIAQCDWRLGEFYCDPSKGYMCELWLPTNFSIFINKTARCVNSGEFIIDVAHQQPIRCNVSEYTRNHPDPISQSVSTTTSEDELINETNSISVVVGVCVSLVISVIVAVFLVWMKKCRKPRHPGTIVATQDFGENKHRENASFLAQTLSETDDSRNWRCLKWIQNFLGLDKTKTSLFKPTQKTSAV